MSYLIKNVEVLEILNKLISLNNQVDRLRLQDKLGEQYYHQNTKKLLEPLTDTIKNTSQDITKTKTESFIENNEAPENLNNILLETMVDRGIKTSYFLPPLSKKTNPQNTTQFNLVKDHNSNRVKDFLTHNSIPIT